MRSKVLLTAILSAFVLLAAADSAQAQWRGRYWGGGYYGPRYGYGYGGYVSPYYGGYYRPYYGGYSANPYGYWSGSPYGSFYGVTPYYNSIEYGVPVESSAAAPSIGSSQSFYSGPAADGNILRFHVVVPKPDAQLWIEDALTKQVGRERDFISPPVEADKNYVYTFRAKWSDNGREITRDKQVKVRVGQPAEIRFE